MKNIFFLFFLFFLPLSLCLADIFIFEDGEKKQGVVLRKSGKQLLAAFTEGDIELEREDLKEVILEERKENLLFLADRARAKGDLPKAYYFYNRALWEDIDDERVQNAIETLRPEGFGDEKVLDWVGNYERFRTDVPPGNDDQILRHNALITEELLGEFGLILNSVGGEIRFVEVRKGGRADTGGIKINDILRQVDGEPAAYMGKYDIIEIMLERAPQNLTLLVEREVAQWVSPGADSVNLLVREKKSDISGKTRYVSVTGGRDIDPSSLNGIMAGDIIVSVDGDKVPKNIDDEKARRLMERSAPNVISVIVLREINI